MTKGYRIAIESCQILIDRVKIYKIKTYKAKAITAFKQGIIYTPGLVQSLTLFNIASCSPFGSAQSLLSPSLTSTLSRLP